METTRRYLAFDIETAKLPEGIGDPVALSGSPVRQPSSPTPTNKALAQRRPCSSGGQDEPGGGYRPCPLPGRANQSRLHASHGNGVGFDLDVLAEESRLLETCRTLALAHVDTRAPLPHKQTGQGAKVHRGRSSGGEVNAMDRPDVGYKLDTLYGEELGKVA